MEHLDFLLLHKKVNKMIIFVFIPYVQHSVLDPESQPSFTKGSLVMYIQPRTTFGSGVILFLKSQNTKKQELRHRKEMF